VIGEAPKSTIGSDRPQCAISAGIGALAAQIGLAGSLTIGDNVALGTKVGINHLKIGDRAQVTAMSAVKKTSQWALGRSLCQTDQAVVREIVAVERLVRDSTPIRRARAG
jgi:UDP-3-O-[3-hydroxymyristoyl] glucosamine N-acyltransferase